MLIIKEVGNNSDWSIMWSCNTIKAEIYNGLMPY